MPLSDPVVGMFTEEWDRFKRGVEALHPDEQRNQRQLIEQRQRRTPQGNAIVIPNWDDVVHLRPRYQLTQQERNEYFEARRERREPNISEGARQEIRRRAIMARNIADSPDRATASSWGAILTAVDNVQDFFSTLATFGRLATWLAPRALTRLVPGIGWILLVGDLLNLMQLLGLLGIVGYGLACHGPAQALAAGLPGALMKRALKAETWKLHSLNPFGRAARAARGLRALGGLPRVGNTLEVLQTTDQLFGRGLSFGALVGLATGAAQIPVILSRGGSVDVRPSAGAEAMLGKVNRPFWDDETSELWLQLLAADVLAQAPLVLAHRDLLDDDDVLRTLVAVREAAALWRHRLRGQAWQEIIAGMAGELVPAPTVTDPVTVAAIEDAGLSPHGGLGWPLLGGAAAVPAGAYAEWTAERVGPALRAWFTSRRSDPRAGFAGAMVGETVDALFLMAEEDDHLLKWELTTDARLISSLVEAGLLPLVTAPEGPLWRMWQEARALIEAHETTALQSGEWRELLERHQIPYARLLAPDAPWPPEWTAWAATLPRS